MVDSGQKQPLRGTSASNASMARPETPEFVSRAPVYPASVVYILYREYLHKNPGLTTLSPENEEYQRYLERRLRQLYPHKGYAGMMRDALEENRQQRLAWAAYQRDLHDWKKTIGVMACTETSIIDPDTGESCSPPADDGSGTTSDPAVDPSWEGQEEYLPPSDDAVPTLQMEIDSLQMEQPEIEKLYYQESLADGSFFSRWDEVIVTTTGKRATIDDLIVATGNGWTPLGRQSGREGGAVTIQVDPVTVAAVLVHAYVGYKAWRVSQAADRARAKSAQYFPGEYSSTHQDAYRHIFWNMQMHRYAGSFTAKVIADTYEARGNNEPTDRVMDLHNNDIGREVRYRNFRGHLVWDRWDWKEWGEKVRNYMNRSENAEYIPEWKSAQTIEAAQAREQLVPDWKYIYFKP
ncbi:MAG: hypothetical protein AVDCRST_MAG68-3959 [uncultured Gemmatimonadetes bacterium]|uniref:DUF6973 domain-containing protein n=1 Tax=uncultured Gemmatimonadota bacterium TaxID=203437 RepID=A0A6J4M2Y2_9BACT|nr:MAG: hypothetical protein AVDCRST_MAG68-3959 [uncultured Gemmatimonadota bacterium]